MRVWRGVTVIIVVAAAVVLSGGGTARAQSAPPVVNLESGTGDNPPELEARCAGGFNQRQAPLEVHRAGDMTTPLSVAYTISGPGTASPASPVTVQAGQELVGLDLFPTLAAHAGDVLTITLQPGDGYTLGSSPSQTRTVVVTSEDCNYPVSAALVHNGSQAFVTCAGDTVPSTPAAIELRRPDAVLQSVTVAYTFNGVSATFDFAQANSRITLEFDEPGHFELVDGDQYGLADASALDVTFVDLSPTCGLARTGPRHAGALAVSAVGFIAVGGALVLAGRRREPRASAARS